MDSYEEICTNLKDRHPASTISRGGFIPGWWGYTPTPSTNGNIPRCLLGGKNVSDQKINK
jgi:hypothetical protein